MIVIVIMKLIYTFCVMEWDDLFCWQNEWLVFGFWWTTQENDEIAIFVITPDYCDGMAGLTGVYNSLWCGLFPIKMNALYLVDSIRVRVHVICMHAWLFRIARSRRYVSYYEM